MQYKLRVKSKSPNFSLDDFLVRESGNPHTINSQQQQPTATANSISQQQQPTATANSISQQHQPTALANSISQQH